MFNEKETVELVRAGDNEAFNLLVNESLIKIRPAIFGSFPSLKKEDFDDALQNAMIKAWKRISLFRGDASFSTWFFIIIKNEILNIINANSKIRKFELQTPELFSNEVSGSDLESLIPIALLDDKVAETAQTIMEKKESLSEYRDLIDEVMSKLNPEHQKIIQLTFKEEKSYEQVAEELKIPIGTVMSRIFYARKNAQKLIKQYATRSDIQLAGVGR